MDGAVADIEKAEQEIAQLEKEIAQLEEEGEHIPDALTLQLETLELALQDIETDLKGTAPDPEDGSSEYGLELELRGEQQEVEDDTGCYGEPEEPPEPAGPSIPVADDSGGGGGCFPAGTAVQKEGGEVPIEEIEAGDVLLGYDPTRQRHVAQKVAEVFVNDERPVVSLEFESERIVCTPEQPFFSDEWTPAGQLRCGDAVMCAGGAKQRLMQDPVAAEARVTFNVRLSPGSSYLVGRTAIVAHNKNVADEESVPPDPDWD